MRTTTKREVLLIIRVDVSEVVKKRGESNKASTYPSETAVKPPFWAKLSSIFAEQVLAPMHGKSAICYSATLRNVDRGFTQRPTTTWKHSITNRDPRVRENWRMKSKR